MSDKTNEQIFKEAWTAANKRGEQNVRVKAGLAALEAAGRLASEPTDEQVERAAKALESHRHVMVAPGPHECSCGEELDGWAAAHRRHQARAVLKAAGVTPQAPLPEYIEVGHPSGERQPVEPQPVYDVDKIARVIERGFPLPWVTRAEINPRTAGVNLAQAVVAYLEGDAS